MSKYIAAALLIILSQALVAMKLEMSIFSKGKPSKSIEKKLLISKNDKPRRAGDVNRVEISAYEQAKTYPELFSTLPIAQIRKSFAALPDECKRFALATMSTRMQLMYAVATILPEDVIKNHILFFMLDKQAQAAEKFYNKPIGSAFDLYHRIKYGLADDDKLIGPLYAQSKIEREFILEKMSSSWHYFQPMITVGDQEKIEAMGEDMQHYFRGKKMNLLPSAKQVGCTDTIAGVTVCVACGLPLCMSGIMTGFSLLECGSGCFCGSSTLGVIFGITGGLAGMMGCIFGVTTVRVVCDKTQEITL